MERIAIDLLCELHLFAGQACHQTGMTFIFFRSEKMRIKTFCVVGLGLFLLVGGRASGATIPGLFNTGVLSNGSVADGDSIDLHYSYAAHPAGADTVFVASTVDGLYFPDSATSKWIGPATTLIGPLPLATGTYDYRLTFDLSGMNPATANITGQWSTDNNGVIKINGVTTSNTTDVTAYTALHPFTISSGFVAGINQLDFVVTNTDATTALRVDGLQGSVSAPEPAGLVFLGLGGVVWGRRRRV
jgi:hypothetical protein